MSNTEENEIVTPTTVEGFRKNLKRYYHTVGDNLWTLVNGRMDYYDIGRISSFSDIYRLTNTGCEYWCECKSPMIFPLVTVKWEYQDMMDGKRPEYTIVDEWDEVDNPMWYSLDNQMLRDFYMLTLGEFSGYIYCDEEDENERKVG